MIIGWPEWAAATHGSEAGTPTRGSTPATGAKAGVEFTPPGPAWRTMVRFWARSRVATSTVRGSAPGPARSRSASSTNPATRAAERSVPRPSPNCPLCRITRANSGR